MTSICELQRSRPGTEQQQLKDKPQTSSSLGSKVLQGQFQQIGED